MRLVFFILFFTQLAYAQTDTTLLVEEKGGADRFKITLKLDVTGLINPFISSTGFVSDIRLSKNWSLEGELGVYFYAPETATIKNETYNGLKSKVGFKYWVNPTRLKYFYIGLLLGNRYIINKNYRNFLVQDQYIETILVKRKVLVGELDFRLGLLWNLGEKKRFILEAFWGAGIRFNRVTIQSPDKSAEIQNEFRGFINLQLPDGDSVLPSIYLLGLNIGYIIK